MCGLGGKPESRGLPCPRDGASLRALPGKGFFLLPTSSSLKKKTNNIPLLQRRVRPPRHGAPAELCVGQPQRSRRPWGGRGTRQAQVYVFKVNNCIYRHMVSLAARFGGFSLRDVGGALYRTMGQLGRF